MRDCLWARPRCVPGARATFVSVTARPGLGARTRGSPRVPLGAEGGDQLGVAPSPQPILAMARALLAPSQPHSEGSGPGSCPAAEPSAVPILGHMSQERCL